MFKSQYQTNTYTYIHTLIYTFYYYYYYHQRLEGGLGRGVRRKFTFFSLQCRTKVCKYARHKLSFSLNHLSTLRSAVLLKPSRVKAKVIPTAPYIISNQIQLVGRSEFYPIIIRKSFTFCPHEQKSLVRCYTKSLKLKLKRHRIITTTQKIAH